MKVFHWQSKNGNFGDDLNLWLWPALLGDVMQREPESTLVGVGTVLSSRHLPSEGRIYTFGSGTGYGNISPEIYKNFENIYGVRGPLSAQVLGLDSSYVLADPAILIPDIIKKAEADSDNTKSVIFIPHIESLELADWQKICDAADIELVKATDESKAVINKIANASLVLAESMHAAIIADAYRVPWIPVWSSQKINLFKWSDWALAVGATVKPVKLPPPTFAIKFNNFSANVSAFNDADLKSTNFDYTIDPASVVEEYKNLVNKRNGKFRTFARKCLNKIKPIALILSPFITKVIKSEEKTIRSLTELSKLQGFLSDTGSLESAKERLRSRLIEFKKDISE